MSQIALERLRRKFGAAILDTHAQHGNETAVVVRDQLVEIATFLRDDTELQFNMPIDCTAVDWLNQREPRFEVTEKFLVAAGLLGGSKRMQAVELRPRHGKHLARRVQLHRAGAE